MSHNRFEYSEACLAVLGPSELVRGVHWFLGDEPYPCQKCGDVDVWGVGHPLSAAVIKNLAVLAPLGFLYVVGNR